MSSDPNKKTARTFQCRDALWDTFQQMAQELECSIDYLVNETMKQYARQRYAARTPGQSGGRTLESTMPPTASGSSPPGPGENAGLRAALGPPPLGAPPLGGPPLHPVRSSLPPAPSASAAHALPPPPARRGGPTLPPPPQRAAPAGYQHAAATGPAPAMNNSARLPPPPAPPPPAGIARGATAPPPLPRTPPPPAPLVPPAARLPTPPAAASYVPAGTQNYGGQLSVIYAGERMPITKDRFVIGRGKQSSDLTIKDPNVSRQHAMVEFLNGQYYMVDMGSTNGVEYSGQRIARKVIAEGDTYRICDHEVRFTYR